MTKLAFLAVTAASAVTADMKMDFACVGKHCLKQLAKAAIDKTFWSNAHCELGCDKLYHTDTSPEKLAYQNCTTTCALTYESRAGDDFLACAMNNFCVTFPEIPGECPMPAVSPDLSLADMAGEWWQHRGKNALWDCYKCQHIHSMFLVDDAEWCAQTSSPLGGPVQAPCWNYSYSYDLYVEGGTKYFGQSWQLPANIEAGKQIDIYYEYMGSYHNETWFLLDAVADKFLILVDCSYMNTWINVGSIVWVRPGYVLSSTDNARIAKVYREKLGWEFNDFCYDVHGAEHCDGPKDFLPISERTPAAPHFAKGSFPFWSKDGLAAVQKMADQFALTPKEIVNPL